MLIDEREITRAEAAKLAELLGGKVESCDPSMWSETRDIALFSDDSWLDWTWGVCNGKSYIAVLVANRLAAMNAKGPLESMICYSLHNRSDPGYEAKFGAETVFIARIERQDDFATWIGKSPDLAEAVLGAAILWTRAVMAEEAAK